MDEIKPVMNTADWRWAAEKGFWDPRLRCWSEERGGMKEYLRQRDLRRAERLHKRNPESTRKRAYNQTFTARKRGDGSQCHSETESPIKRVKKSSLRLPVIWFDESAVDAPLLQFMVANNWAQSCAQRYWRYGYQSERVMNMFMCIPSELKSAILECLMLSSQRELRFDEEFRVSEEANCANQSSHWEEDATHGYVQVDFCLATQRRLAVAVNSRMAELLGMNQEDLLGRFARHDVPLAMPPLDAVCVFLHGLLSSHERVTRRYYRMEVGGNQGMALICATSVKMRQQNGVLRARRMVRLVSADEYDAAVRLDPWSSPLAALGDRRAGRQLLADAPTDAADDGPAFAALVASPRGRDMLDRLAQAAAEIARKLRWHTQRSAAPAEPPPPLGAECGFRLVASRSSVALPWIQGTDQSKTRATPVVGLIERNIAPQVGKSAEWAGSAASLVEGSGMFVARSPRGRGNLLGPGAPGCAWRGPLPEPYLFGLGSQVPVGGGCWLPIVGDARGRGALVEYGEEDVGSALSAGGLSPRWAEMVVGRYWACGFQTNCLATVLRSIPRRLDSILEATIRRMAADDAAMNLYDHPDPPSTGPAKSISPAFDEVAAEEVAMWEAEGSQGFLRFDFDPVTHQRRRMCMTSGMARLFGMSCEEAVERFGRREMPLLMTEEDLLRVFIHELVVVHLNEFSVYYRTTLNGGVLICRTTLRNFDGRGRVAAMRHCMRAVTADEYDDATRNRPRCCPLALTGDTRSGSQLLADARGDARQTLSSLAECEPGRARLEQLAARAEALLGRDSAPNHHPLPIDAKILKKIE